MPLYEYECTACHKRTEKIQKFSDTEITICPYCGGPLERVISAPAVSFKGGGWYADGYGNAKPKSSTDGAASSSDSKPSADPKPGGETKSGSDSKNDGNTAASSPPAPSPSAAPAAPTAASSSSDKK